MGAERQQRQRRGLVEIALELAAQRTHAVAVGRGERLAQGLDAGHRGERIALLGTVVAARKQVHGAAEVAQQRREPRQAFAARRHVEREQARRRELADVREPAGEQFVQQALHLREERQLAFAEARGAGGHGRGARRHRAVRPRIDYAMRAPQRHHRAQVHRLAFGRGHVGDHAGEAGPADPAAGLAQRRQAQHHGATQRAPFDVIDGSRRGAPHRGGAGGLEQHRNLERQQLGERIHRDGGCLLRGRPGLRRRLLAQPQRRAEDVLAQARRGAVAARLLRAVGVDAHALAVGRDPAALHVVLRQRHLAGLDVLGRAAQQARVGERDERVVVVCAPGDHPAQFITSASHCAKCTGVSAATCMPRFASRCPIWRS